MTALGIVALILFLLAMLPVGVWIRYGAEGPAVSVVAGWIRIRILPKKNSGEKKTEKKIKPKKAEKQRESTEPQEETAAKKGGSVKDFIPLVKVGLNFLNDFRWKLRVDRLEMKVTLAGGAPDQLAIHYGQAWAALGNFWPVLERSFKIKKRDVSIQCDFEGSETTVYGALKITITLGRTLALAVKYGIRALKEFMKLKNKKKAVQQK